MLTPLTDKEFEDLRTPPKRIATTPAGRKLAADIERQIEARTKAGEGDEAKQSTSSFFLFLFFLLLILGEIVDPTDDLVATTRAWMAGLERLLRRHPQEWAFWLDKHWSRVLRRNPPNV